VYFAWAMPYVALYPTPVVLYLSGAWSSIYVYFLELALGLSEFARADRVPAFYAMLAPSWRGAGKAAV